jgi:general secretion pathway protein I
MKRQAGYSLLEVLVAFALLAAALTILLAALSGASRQVRHGNDAGRARLHAQSLLAGLGIEAPLQAGNRHGDWEDGHYRWQLQVQPWQPDGAPNAAGPQLLEVQLQVRWGERPAEQLTLQGLRLVMPQAGLQ